MPKNTTNNKLKPSIPVTIYNLKKLNEKNIVASRLRFFNTTKEGSSQPYFRAYYQINKYIKKNGNDNCSDTSEITTLSTTSTNATYKTENNEYKRCHYHSTTYHPYLYPSNYIQQKIMDEKKIKNFLEQNKHDLDCKNLREKQMISSKEYRQKSRELLDNPIEFINQGRHILSDKNNKKLKGNASLHLHSNNKSNSSYDEKEHEILCKKLLKYDQFFRDKSYSYINNRFTKVISREIDKRKKGNKETKLFEDLIKTRRKFQRKYHRYHKKKNKRGVVPKSPENRTNFGSPISAVVRNTLK